MTVLRIYDPPKCDAEGVPLDWERCRECHGTGGVTQTTEAGTNNDRCPRCGGHGSLRAAALYGYLRYFDGYENPELPMRCDECGHPMSKGTWEPIEWGHATDDAFEMSRLAGVPKNKFLARGVHYSPCDEGCRHGGPGRYEEPTRLSPRPFWRCWDSGPTGGEAATMVALDNRVEASWRSVDVRVGMVGKIGLGQCFDPSNVVHVRPWDLRLQNLALLCLRCWTML